MNSNSIQTIDCHYYTDEFAAAYLLQEGNEAAFVNNNTNFAIPYLLRALSDKNIPKENVKVFNYNPYSFRPRWGYISFGARISKCNCIGSSKAACM